ncbi:hypothetical protein [Bacillus cereus]
MVTRMDYLVRSLKHILELLKEKQREGLDIAKKGFN